VIRFLLIGILCTAAQAAKADYYLWTWHGFLNDFQGNFEVPDAEMQPGVDFGSTSPLFFDTLSITSTVENVVYNYATASQAAAVGYFAGAGPNDYVLSIGFVDGAGQTGMSYYGSTGTMTELLLNNSGPDFSERGFWSHTYIPEPSTPALLTLGAAGWFFIQRRFLSQRKSQ
jgi:hypothetical protein